MNRREKYIKALDQYFQMMPHEERLRIEEFLLSGDSRLTHGVNVVHYPVMPEVRNLALAGSLMIAAWIDIQVEKGVRPAAEDAEKVFARRAFELDEKLGGAGRCAWLMSYWDDVDGPNGGEVALSRLQRRLEMDRTCA